MNNFGRGGGFGNNQGGGFGGQGGGGFGNNQGGGGGFGNNQGGGGFGGNQNQGGGFGNNNNQGGGFANNQGGGFGGNQNQGGFNNQGGGGFNNNQGGGFGNNQGGGFNNNNNNNNQGGGFGNQNQGGGFGGNNQGGGFGNNNNQGGGFGRGGGGFGNNQGGGGGFGNNQGGGFGGNQNQGGGFGNQGGGGFGNNNNQGGGFGNNQGGGFGRGGGFGNNNQGGGGFGGNNNNQGGGFGGQGGGGFGGNNNQGGGFGNNQGGGFGNNNNQGGGFGGNNQGGGGFGGNQNQGGGFGNNNNQQGGFGNNQGGGGFGNNQGGFGNNQGGGFGGNQNQGGGFGNNNNQGGFNNNQGGGFGGNNNNQGGGFGNNQGGGFNNNQQGFNNQQPNNGMALNQQQSQSLLQQILKIPNYAETPYGNVLLFSDENTSVAATKLEPKTTINIDTLREQQMSISSQLHRPAPPLRVTASAPLPFGTSANASTVSVLSRSAIKQATAATVAASHYHSASTTAVNASLHSQKPTSMAAALIANAPSASSLQPRSVSTAVFLDALNSTYVKMGVTADGHNSFANTDDRDQEVIVETKHIEDNGKSSVGSNNVAPALPTTITPSHRAQRPLPPQAPRCNSTYYVLSPSLTELQSYENEALRAVSNFTITTTDNKVEIRFLEDVNLFATVIDEVIEILPSGKITFYPNGSRPAPGKGLNVPAIVTVRRLTAPADALQEECRIEGNRFMSYNASTQEFKFLINDTTVEETSDLRANGSMKSQKQQHVGAAFDSNDNNGEDNVSVEEGTEDALSQSPVRAVDVSITHPKSTKSAEDTAESKLVFEEEVLNDVVRSAYATANVFQEHHYLSRHGYSGGNVVTTTLNGLSDRHVVTSNAEIEFKLPYELPKLEEMLITKDTRPIAFAIPTFEDHTTTGSVLVNSKKAALIAEAWAPQTTSSNKTSAKTADRVLGRSFRVGWAPDGRIALPRFSALHDACATNPAVPESNTSTTVDVFSPIATIPATPVETAVRVLSALQPYAVATAAAVTTSNDEEENDNIVVHSKRIEFNVDRPSSSQNNKFLSQQKIDQILAVVTDIASSTSCSNTALSPKESASPSGYPSKDSRGVVQQAAIKQLSSLLSLLQALYGLTESDISFTNPIEEREYLAHLRRRTLGDWLQREIRAESSEKVSARTGKQSATTVDAKTAQFELRMKVLSALLEHNVTKATLLCSKLSPSDDLRRIVTLCAHSNAATSQRTSISALENQEKNDSDNNSKNDDIIRLLIGEVAPFINRPCVLKGPTPLPNDNAISWKQLLGIFAFYGCPADADAQTVIQHFSQRIRERRGDTQSEAGEGCLPHYGTANLSNSSASTGNKRSRDIVEKASKFEDSCLHILTAFAEGRCPSTLVLHPNSSTYFDTDVFIPFILIIIIRSLKLERSAEYIEREAETISAFSSQLEHCATSICSEQAIVDGSVASGSPEADSFGLALWWALLSLHMHEDTETRDQAIKAFVQRHLSYLDFVTTRASHTGKADWNVKSSLLSIEFIRSTIQAFLASGESVALCTQLSQAVRSSHVTVTSSGAVTKTSSKGTSARAQLLQYRADLVDAETNRPSFETHRVMKEAMKKFMSELK